MSLILFCMIIFGSVNNTVILGFPGNRITIIGRPNVGKSKIFNKILKSEESLVLDHATTTRDCNYKIGCHRGIQFEVVDTGGILYDENDLDSNQIVEQALFVASSASAIIFIVDAKTGLTPTDLRISHTLRSLSPKVPVVVGANKCESHRTGYLSAQEFWALDLEEPIPCSGIWGFGISDILDRCLEHFKGKVDDDIIKPTISVSVLGRPNVGKSSLMNALLGTSRSIVSSHPGTTTDCVDSLLTDDNDVFKLIDTAGIRKQSRIRVSSDLERLMVQRAFRSLRRSDAAVLVLDTLVPIGEQDLALAKKIEEYGKACVIVGNKWDLFEKGTKSYESALLYVQEKFANLKFALKILLSAKTKIRVPSLLPLIRIAVTNHRRRVKTSDLNRVIRDAIMMKPPTRVKQRFPRIYFATQTTTSPPQFTGFCNDDKLISESYENYLTKALRASFDFQGTPLRWIWRTRSRGDRLPDDESLV